MIVRVRFKEFDQLQNKSSWRDSNNEFEPSMTVLKRILKVLLEKNSIGRTRLSQSANVHFDVLSKYLKWMEKRKYVESVVEKEKAVTQLTPEGRSFGLKLLSLYD